LGLIVGERLRSEIRITVQHCIIQRLNAFDLFDRARFGLDRLKFVGFPRIRLARRILVIARRSAARLNREAISAITAKIASGSVDLSAFLTLNHCFLRFKKSF
jgi:hypothetical protein